MSVVGLLERAEALQSPVHAGGAHEAAHGGEASQMHCECRAWAVGLGAPDGALVRVGLGSPAGPRGWGAAQWWEEPGAVMNVERSERGSGIAGEDRSGEGAVTTTLWGTAEAL